MRQSQHRRNNLDKKPSEERCPRCDNLMERRKHKEVLDFIKKQPYYYTEWDYCRPCKYIQHYEKFRKINN